MSNVILPNNANFKSYQQNSGRYRYLRIPMNNKTGNTITLSATASDLIEFKLPVCTYNKARSVFSYSEYIPLAATATYAFDNTLEIADRIQFGTSGGHNLLDLNFANNYINVTRPIDTPIDVFLTNDSTSGLYKAPQSTNVFPPGYVAPDNNIFGIVPAAPNLLASSDLEPRYAQISTVGSGLNHVRNFPLSGVTDTILAIDRDCYYGNEMYLRINTALSSKVGYTATTALNGVGGATALVTQPVLTNVYLYLAVEQDSEIIKAVMDKFHAGTLHYQVPWVQAFRNPTVTGVASIQIQLNNQYGKKLKRVIHAPFPTAETVNKAYDHSNLDGSKITGYQTYMDSKIMQDQILSCLQPVTSDAAIAAQNGNMNFDDWRENAKHCKNTAIQNASSYALNWFHCDRFSEKNHNTDIPESSIDEGLDMSTPRSWAIQMTTAVDLTNYTFCSFSRDLAVTPAGPVWQ